LALASGLIDVNVWALCKSFAALCCGNPHKSIKSKICAYDGNEIYFLQNWRREGLSESAEVNPCESTMVKRGGVGVGEFGENVELCVLIRSLLAVLFFVFWTDREFSAPVKGFHSN
jgi:hypothetical protein